MRNALQSDTCVIVIPREARRQAAPRRQRQPLERDRELWTAAYTEAAFEAACSAWLNRGMDMVDFAAALGIADNNNSLASLSVSTIDRAADKCIQEHSKLMLYCMRNNLARNHDNLSNDLNRILALIYHTRHMLRSFASMQRALESNTFTETLPPLLGVSLAGYEPDDPYQEWLGFLLNEISLRGVALSRTNIYIKEFAPTGHFTYYWRESCTLQNWINKVTDRSTHHRFWCTMTDGNNLKRACWFLEQSTDPLIQRIEKDRNIISFSNGVYFMRTNRFHEYSAGSLDPEPCSSRYFESAFNPEWCTMEIEELNLVCHERVFDTQEWPEEPRLWYYISAGRWFYPVGELDDWQYVPYCKGLAGTGKSTLLGNLAKVRDSEDVGLITNTIESTFGLSSQYDKYGIVATEIGKGFKLDQKAWQNMVSGENVVIAVKGKAPINVHNFTTSMFMAGNDWLPFDDSAGSASRRTLGFLFSIEVRASDSDPNLKKKLEDELPMFIVKSNRCYLRALDEYQNKNIWLVVPNYFHEVKQTANTETDPLMAFLTNTDELVFDPASQCRYSEFQALFNAYCQSNNLGRCALTNDNTRNAFKSFSLEKKRVSVGQGQRLVHIVGCRFQNQNQPEEQLNKTY